MGAPQPDISSSMEPQTPWYLLKCECMYTSYMELRDNCLRGGRGGGGLLEPPGRCASWAGDGGTGRPLHLSTALYLYVGL